MKNRCFKFLMPILICTVGCATDTRVALLKPVGPDPALAAQSSGPGYLQVYSARERAPIDLNTEDFLWNNDFGKNEFLHWTAHTRYSLYAPDGHLLQQVRNSTGMNDANPTAVKLSPGVYQVEAEAEDYNDVTLNVMVPVLIEPGLTTVVHLDGNSNTTIPRKQSDELVRLPNGNIVGWQTSTPDNSTPRVHANI